jgi:hypothetical protein
MPQNEGFLVRCHVHEFFRHQDDARGNRMPDRFLVWYVLDAARPFGIVYTKWREYEVPGSFGARYTQRGKDFRKGMGLVGFVGT